MTNASYVYILTNQNKTVLYTGITNDLVRRMTEHKTKTNKSFASKYNADQLVYYEVHQDIAEAITREKMIKKKSRRGKELLISGMNKDWSDLSLNIV